MATLLTKTKKETQLILKWGGISLSIILVFLIGIRLVEIIKQSLTPPPPPQALFGKLPAIPFPNQQKENIIYTVDTLSGFLPNFGDRAKVYKTNMTQPNLLALEKTQERVSRLGFNPKGTRIAPDIYQWTEPPSTPQRRLTVDIFSKDFTLSSPYLVASSLQTLNDPKEQSDAVELAKSFLSNMTSLPADLNMDKTKVTLYSIEKGDLIPSSKTADTKIVRVDFFQADLDKLPIFYEKGITSTIYLLTGKENNRLKIVEAHYSHKDVSDMSSTYAIKSTNQAFEELKQGKAYIASQPQDTVEITIKDVFLGYYVGEAQQEFLMPIIIFTGDDNFIAYVSAVKDEWINPVRSSHGVLDLVFATLTRHSSLRQATGFSASNGINN